MLLSSETIERIKTGEISVLFRRWRRAGVKVGGTQMTQGGVIAIDAVDVLTESDITDEDALESGYPSRAQLISHLAYRDDDIYRIRVHYAGEDTRIALRENADLTDDELAEVLARLDKLDTNSRRGAWTLSFLQAIHDRPSTYSGILAKSLGLEIPQFKPWVRKLKALGLTESLEIGYRLSPRGEKLLRAISSRNRDRLD